MVRWAALELVTLMASTEGTRATCPSTFYLCELEVSYNLGTRSSGMCIYV